MSEKLDIIAIGECLLELSTKEYFENAETFNLSCGGDVLTSALAARRIDAKVGLVSVIGDDSFKNIILERLNNQGFELSHLRICPEKNGLYLCGHTERKELVTYRRRVASNCMSLEDYDEEYIKSANVIYTTGITQSLSIQATQLVKKVFQTARENDILTAYDPNYSSSFMTAYDTKEYLEEIVENIDVLFLSLKNDVEALFELSSVEKMVNYYTDLGVKIIVIKSHLERGYYVHSNGKTDFVPFYSLGAIKNSMGAGDVFNGGFLGAIVKGYSPYEATQLAAKQTGIFIENQGLIKNIPNVEELLRL